MKIRNMTGQDLTVYVENDKITTIPSEGKVWVTADYEYVGHVEVEDDIPIPVLAAAASKDDTNGVPPFEEGTFLIVSGLVASLLPGRGDLISPAKVVRAKTADGRRVSVGCRAFITQSHNFGEDDEDVNYNLIK